MKILHYAALGGLCTLLAGCPNDNDDDNMAMPPATQTMVKFEVKITNETAGQPFSPMTLVAHKAEQRFWELGSPVSVGLEYIAETGNPSVWRSDLKANANVYATWEGKGLILPSKSESFVIELDANQLNNDARLSFAVMMGKTNDGLVLMDGQAIKQLKVGETVSTRLLSYDAGTELNRETAETLGSAGFNPMRDDVTSVLTIHSGVVSKDDGLSNSALTQLEKWDHSVAKVDIKRL